jgi:hypothetical protein
MNELDFDELDNAVNSLVSKDQSNSGASAEPDVKEPKESNKVPVRDSKLTPDLKKERPRMMVKPAVPATARGTNRGYIDIMAPKPALKAPPRVSPTIAPIAPLSNVNLPVAPVRSKMEVEEKESDVLPKASVLPVEPPKFTEQTIEPDEDTVELPEPSVAPTSPTPFVNADKVEKRPLGAYSEYSPNEAKAKVVPISTPEVEDSSVSPELSPDMLAVESGEPQPEKPEHAEPKSIPPQYKKAEKTVDDTPRPVYDSQDYHPPLLEAKVERKKLALWIKIVIVVLVLALLGVGGYFAYQFMMQAPATQ